MESDDEKKGKYVVKELQVLRDRCHWTEGDRLALVSVLHSFEHLAPASGAAGLADRVAALPDGSGAEFMALRSEVGLFLDTQVIPALRGFDWRAHAVEAARQVVGEKQREVNAYSWAVGLLVLLVALVAVSPKARKSVLRLMGVSHAS